jgi:hypothetical protein
MMVSQKKQDIGVDETKILSDVREWTIGELIELLGHHNLDAKVHILVAGYPGSSFITVSENGNNIILVGFKDN